MLKRKTITKLIGAATLAQNVKNIAKNIFAEGGVSITDYKMKILVIDDFSAMRNIVKNLLKRLGYENIEEAKDGAQAYSKLKSERYSFIVSDWNMPNMDGLALLNKIRSDSELKNMPFLMVAADTEKEKVIEAVKSGLNNYIVKPFTSEALKEKMDQIFENLGK